MRQDEDRSARLRRGDRFGRDPDGQGCRSRLGRDLVFPLDEPEPPNGEVVRTEPNDVFAATCGVEQELQRQPGCRSDKVGGLVGFHLRRAPGMEALLRVFQEIHVPGRIGGRAPFSLAHLNRAFNAFSIVFAAAGVSLFPLRSVRT